MTKEIARIKADYDDQMVIINLVEEIDVVLSKYHLSIEVEDAEHDGFETIIIKELID